MSHTYEYPRPALTVDAVVFTLGETGKLEVLLIKRGTPPFKDAWALPGGFVRVGEGPDAAIIRELEEETGYNCAYLEQLGAWGKPDRDPREHVVTIAWYALVNRPEQQVRGASDASDAAWFDIENLPELAFDHKDILKTALERLRQRIRRRPIGFDLLPEKFPLRALQTLYESVLGKPLDKRNFRKKALSTGILEELDEIEQNVQHRAARMHRFRKDVYEQKVKDGWLFDL